jgi:hypothetical protein
MKDVNATAEAFIRKKKIYISSLFYLFVDNFCPPRSISGSSRPKSKRIWIHNTGICDSHALMQIVILPLKSFSSNTFGHFGKFCQLKVTLTVYLPAVTGIF